MSNTNLANSTAKTLKENMNKRKEVREGKEDTKVIDTQDYSSNQSESVNVNVKQTSTSTNSTIDSQIEELKLQAENWKSKAMRFAADNQNILKQHELDNQQVIKRTKKMVVTLIMPFLTSMNLAFGMMPQSDDQVINKYIDGLKSQLDKLIGDLKNVQVDIIVPMKGQEFDPVIMTSLNSAEDDELTVKQVIGLGLKIDGQIIQAATVMI